jgi:hypothetical protein
MINQKSEPDTQTVSEIVRELRSIAIHSLARMYRPKERLFAFRLRRGDQGEVLEGVSRRYTATALIGLVNEDQDVTAEVLGNHRREDVCGRLLGCVEESRELGEIALTTWAARRLRHPRARKALDALKRMDPTSGGYPTVELSWALAALVIDGAQETDMALAERIADVLIGSFRPESGLFPHAPVGKGLSALRAHVSCFADFVYPIQALSYYHQATGDARAAEVATCCAERMCELQGSEGQWWWHFDVRSGRVVEHYPVYAVHQDAMAPMALFALARACGLDHFESIENGLNWLINPPEIVESLIEAERNIIWRKVARREPRKLVRSLQATASRLHPAIRVLALDVLFPPVSIDYETRPYHMGWLLHAWSANCTVAFARQSNFKREVFDKHI